MNLFRDIPFANTARLGGGSCRAFLAIVVTAISLFVLAPVASASKEVIDYFGTDPSVVRGTLGGEFTFPAGIAVNQSGAGPAGKGDVYVVDQGFSFPEDKRTNRIERYRRDDNETPINPYDDTYHFVSAWGADVVSAGTGDLGGAVDANYEVCSVASQCKTGVGVGGNGTAVGNGDLDFPKAIAVDQDTGDVYVTDDSSRINVYDGTGKFLRSYGYDVVASGPGNQAGATERQQLTVKADGGKFSLSFRGATTGAEGTGALDVDSAKVTKVQVTSGTFAVGQAVSGSFSGCLPPHTTIVAVGGGTITLSNASTCNTPSIGLVADSLPFDASAAEIQAALNGLPTIGGAVGSVTVTGGPGDPTGASPYVIDFDGTLAGKGVPQLGATSANLSTSSGTPSTSVVETVPGGVFEICEADAGDICQAGSSGFGAGEIGDASFDGRNLGVAITPPDGSPTSGTVYVADTGNHRINTYPLDGSAPSAFGSAAIFGGPAPRFVAVDTRGIVYASNDPPGPLAPKIERYDSEGANGPVGFLAPLPAAIAEEQRVTVDATSGQFRLSFGGQETGDLPFNVPAEGGAGSTASVRKALEALPSINTDVSVQKGGFGGSVYTITFGGTLGATDVEQLGCKSGSTPLSGGSGCSVTTVIDGAPGLPLDQLNGLAVDSDSDGAGPDSDVLYILGGKSLLQVGPVNPPGLATPPSGFDEKHGVLAAFSSLSGGIALDETTGSIYVTAPSGAGQEAHGVYVLNTVGGLPSVTVDSVSDVKATGVTVHATINPNGAPDVTARIEYSRDGTTWLRGPETLVGHQESPQVVSQLLEPSPFGLEPNTLYHVRVAAVKKFATPVTSSELTFTTAAEAPQAETDGSPVRSATTARLEGRVGPRNSATTYHFEYGEQGPCDSSPCQSSPARPAGSGSLLQQASQEVEGLTPGTTYHYRLVAEGAAPGSPSFGADMTLTTRTSDQPLSHGHVAGPPASDRGWEQVNAPDTGGNPVASPLGFSADGERAAYSIPGGTPLSNTGGIFSQFYAERTPDGWQPVRISPSRAELAGSLWEFPHANEDLSSLVNVNYDNNTGVEANIWRLFPDRAPEKLYEQVGLSFAPQVIVSADTSRVLLNATASLDPAHPVVPGRERLFDITAAGGLNGGPAPMVSLLPGDAVPACGFGAFSPAFDFVPQLSADGDRLFFPSQGDGPCGNGEAPTQIYMRDLLAGETRRLSPLPLSGPDCGASFSRRTFEAVFFSTVSRLVAEDDVPAGSCSGSADVYRFDLASGEVRCLTCMIAGLGSAGGVAVSEDGSRVYFASLQPLLKGAASDGTYRLDVTSGDLAYLGALNAPIGSDSRNGQAMTADGAVVIFRSKAPTLNPLGGTDNGGGDQYYRYDDRDGSLICVSCPEDGVAPRGAVAALTSGAGTNHTVPLSADGEDFAFATPTALSNADQNTARAGQDPVVGNDAYEWRDGRQLLLSDGITSWPPSTGFSPKPAGMSASGRDVYFVAAAQLTQNALDTYPRLYDARIGGGFEFPPPSKPCPLEVCQGTPKGVPEDGAPGTGSFAGPGNKPKSTRSPCPKGKRKVRRAGKTRCVAKRKLRANRNRRAGR